MNLYTAVAIPFLLMTTPYVSVAATKPTETVIAPKPVARLSFGHGIEMIVKGLGLNIDNIRFIKAPKATDYFKNADNNASYAEALIIAANNGVNSNRNINPATPATREQFALALFEAIQSTGQYPVNMMWINIKDQASFGKNTLIAVQTLIKFRVVELKNDAFRPKALITPEEAQRMVDNAATFLQEHKKAITKNDVTFSVKPINDQVNSVVLTGAEQPNSGYRLTVTSIVFADQEAIIHYKLITPDPNSMNLQVITTPMVTTYIPAGYKVVLQAD
ncbi:protease complex subunit PrcB family protein [Chitinophaga silvatica]|nr:protease complex subunit PrcB family protein [Chitinophaga silvatica]